MKKKTLESALLNRLEEIDLQKETGRISQQDHNKLSKRAVKLALSKAGKL